MQLKLKTVRAWSLAAAALLFVTCGAMADDLWVSVGPSGDALVGPSTSAAVPVVTVTESETAGFRARVEVTGFGATPKQTPVGEFLDLHWPDASIAGEIGAPGLPVVRRLFVAPPEAMVSVRVDAGAALVIDMEAEGLPWRVLSVQPPIEKVPGAIERAEFQYDEAAYRTSPIATELATVEEVGIVRGQRLLLLEVRPIEYDPVARTLTYRPELEVGVQFHGGRAPDSAVSPLRGLYRIVLNPELLHGPTGGGRGSGNYLIIVASVYETDIAAFGTAKGAQGFTVTTHAVAAGTTNSAIKTYIQGLWGGADAPDYILLVGDTDTIPHWTGGGAGSPSTDLPYTCMDGSTDWHPDIAIGRFPVRSSSQLQAIVDKTLYYENGPLSDPDYLKRAVFMASADNYTVSEGTHNWVIDNYMDPNDIVSDKLYCHTYNATTQQVRDSFNDGRFFGIYSGHGGTYSWADGPPFSQTDVNNLTNADMYAFVMSFACVTGTYTVNECFTETWIRAPNKGALTIYGSSVNSYWTEDDVLEKRQFDSIYDYEDNVLSEVGPVWVDTLLRYEAQMGSGSTTRRYFEMYNLMGDPSLRFPGACSDAGTVELDHTRYACEGTVSVTVNDCGLNLDNVVVETVTVDIDSDSETGVEQVVLTETDPASAEFEGSIALSAANSSGVLLVADGDTVTVTYIDADDGQGGYNVVVTATAVVDCAGPVISNVAVSGQSSDTATVTFDTDESAIGTVRYGLSCSSLTETVTEWIAGTSHTLELTGLDSGTQYYFAVDAMDVVGNPSTDDNGGDCYSFSTLGIVYGFTMDGDPGWSTQGLWAFGQPTGSGGASGGPDPTSGYTGSSVYGYNLDGDYTNDMPVYYLTTSALNLTGTTNVQLRFWKWLGIENALFDHAKVQVSSSGISWTTIWEHTGGNTSDSSWSQMLFDISAVADDQPVVYVRWGMGRTDASNTYCGWNIDDVEIWGLTAQGATCSDGIQNQGEARIDCGGPCPSCDCLSDGECDDGLFCTGVETCDAYGHCQPGTPVNCDDGVGCTVDSCDEVNDTCVNVPDDGLCDDGEFCDGVETCDPALDCQAGTPVDCTDGVGCTVDSCDEVNDTCVNAPDDGLCDDGEFCNGAETCDPVDDCQAGEYPCGAGAWCNEGDDACIPHGNGDFDGDGDVDLGDFADFQVCFGQPVGLGCQPGNMTGTDAMIDLDDFAVFAAVLNGPQ